jgi:hypothetical protein
MSTLSSLASTTTVDFDIEREPLPSADSSEPVLDTHHPFVAFKETHRASGAWRVRVQTRDDATTLLYPNAIRLQARAVSEKGRSSFTWTNPAFATSGAAEPIRFRVHVNDGEPAAIEVLPTNPAAGRASPVRFSWPSA